MREEQLNYLEALAKDLDSRGEVASAGMVLRVMVERAELLAALQWLVDEMADAGDARAEDGKIFGVVQNAVDAIYKATGTKPEI